MIILISDFDLAGSGYKNIAVPLGNGLSRRGMEIKALGIGYKGDEHDFDFGIIPVAHTGMIQIIRAMIKNLYSYGVHIEAVVTAMDLYLHRAFLDARPADNIPYIGIFPVESSPLTRSWGSIAMMMDKAFVISKFGEKEMHRIGVEHAEHMPVGVDTQAWKPPTEEERAKLRGAMGLEEDDFFILTVADNNERKNLWATAETVAKFKEKGHSLKWALVSRISYSGGWNWDDLPFDLGIQDIFMPFERGIRFSKLWQLFAVADAFLISSKAEGLGMPILEAMAMNLPVVAPRHTAITEHITGGRGFPVDNEYEYGDPFGNSRRFFVSVDKSVEALEKLAAMSSADRKKMTKKARAYVTRRKWEIAVEQLYGVLEDIKLEETDRNVAEEISEEEEILL